MDEQDEYDLGMSDEERAEMYDTMDKMIYDDHSTYPIPKPETKPHIFNFFMKIIALKNNAKTAFLNEDELGYSKIPVRTNLELANYCKAMGNKGYADYFIDEAQIMLSTSLSRKGFLIQQAVTQRKESEFKTRIPVTQRKGFFTKKEEGGEVM